MRLQTEVARLAFADQILAALHEHGPCSSETLAEQVATVFCTCAGCQGATRAGWPGDLFPTLGRLTRSGLVQGVLEPVDGSDVWDVRWRRVAPACAMEMPEL